MIELWSIIQREVVMGVNNQFFPYANKEEGVCCSVLTMRKEDKDV